MSASALLQPESLQAEDLQLSHNAYGSEAGVSSEGFPYLEFLALQPLTAPTVRSCAISK